MERCAPNLLNRTQGTSCAEGSKQGTNPAGDRRNSGKKEEKRKKKKLALGLARPRICVRLEEVEVLFRDNQKHVTMKTRRIQQSIRGALGAVLVGFTTFVCAPANAAHEHIYALQYGGLTLFDFYSDAPQNVLNAYAINGLQFGETIQSIDYWNGTIYGLGSSSRLYTINPNTGLATQVGAGQFSPILNGFTFGVDNDPSGLRVVSGNLQNLLVSRATGAVLSSGPNIVAPRAWMRWRTTMPRVSGMREIRSPTLLGHSIRLLAYIARSAWQELMSRAITAWTSRHSLASCIWIRRQPAAIRKRTSTSLIS